MLCQSMHLGKLAPRLQQPQPRLCRSWLLMQPLLGGDDRGAAGRASGRQARCGAGNDATGVLGTHRLRFGPCAVDHGEEQWVAPWHARLAAGLRVAIAVACLAGSGVCLFVAWHACGASSSLSFSEPS